MRLPIGDLLLQQLLDDAHPAVQGAAAACLPYVADRGVIAYVLDGLPDRSMVVDREHVRQATGEYQGALRIMALVTLLSAIVPLLLHPPSVQRKPSTRESGLGGASHRIAT